MKNVAVLVSTLLPMLAPALAAVIRGVSPTLLNAAAELRLRSGRPLLVVAGNRDVMVTSSGHATEVLAEAYHCTREDLSITLQLISRNSLYAFEEQLKAGFITVAGGHRVGLAGQAVLAGGEVRSLKNISAMNIRLAREVHGAADKLLPYVIAGPGRILSTLIISPPRCGKTTVLRDLVRQLSSGVAGLDFPGVQLGVVDERSEIAACQDGVPTAELGPRVDVLDACPKAVGMLMLIRSMSPQVVVTDEIGREEDVRAIREALSAGVGVLATVHGREPAEILQRPYVGELIRDRCFDRYALLSDTPIAGTLEKIVAVRQEETLYCRGKGVRVCG